VNQQILIHQLAKIGCHVAGIAETGKKALELIDTAPVDVVLMDCQMPELDGYDTARAIRARERERQKNRVWIVALTAHAMAGDRERCIRAGMDDYLSKPVSETALFDALEKIVAQVNVTDSAEGITPGSDPLEKIILDPRMLNNLRDWGTSDSAGIFEELCDQFTESGARLIARIGNACERDDWQGVREASHTLRGSAAHFGAIQLVGICERIETASHDANFEEIRRRAAEIPLSFEKVCTALAACRTTPSPK
jgi:CheY-like chemotaxis protein/HPt (histidine-containing phosphotransfer) domain-containing protein